jgi:hypothetical protein
MIAVPPWVAVKLSLREEYLDEDALRADFLSFEGDETFPAVGVDDLVTALCEPRLERVEFVEAAVASPWRFAKVAVGVSDQCLLIELGNQIDASIPTASIRTFVRAWLLREENSFEWILSQHAGKVLVAWENDGSKFNGSLFVTLAGIALPDPVKCGPLKSSLATNVAVPSGALLLREAAVYEGILQAASRNTSPPLRFLYLYRLFERAYLIDALEKLQRDFYNDPKRSIKTAETTVSNEKVSFLALVEGTPAEVLFVAIEGLFQDAQSRGSNRFMIALYKAASDDKELDHREPWKRGCVLTYKMRCAVVHSGKAGPVYESFSDSSTACELVSDKLEDAAFALLGITATT